MYHCVSERQTEWACSVEEARIILLTAAAGYAEGIGPLAVIQYHRPEQTLLYQIVEEYCPAFIARQQGIAGELPA